MSKKIVYFRVGTDKAGTVSIANFVDQNKKKLEELGYLAPTRNCIGLIDSLVKQYDLKNIDFFNPNNFFKNYPQEQVCNDIFNKQDSVYHKGKNIILTTETLWGRLSRKNILNPLIKGQIFTLLDAIKERFYEHEIKIILYLRRADTYFESLYGQHIKSGGFQTQTNFFNDKTLNKIPENSLELLKIFITVFGKKNIIIKPLERTQMLNNDLLDDLCNTIGLPFNDGVFIKSVGNEGLHRALQIVLLDVNKSHGKLFNNKDLLTISDFLKNELNIPDSKFILSKKDRLKILKNFDSFYSEVIKHLLPNNELIFIEPIPKNEEYHIPNNILILIERILFDSIGKNITSDYLQQFKFNTV